ncbi:putative fused malic enzyme oxidoreductase; putative phosphotransacetylase [Burkholderiales bacterium]|jgi:malate dehydrogenase (oxaloacetate-decarboxylating)(NADP+)|nr:putative fused malic enzyme oxidoreductase; putative phosphotransacetylase [Burkholderiales bacterium]
MPTSPNAELRSAALEYHEFPQPGKISITPTKQLVNQRDLALAYSPGVAHACEAIVNDPSTVARYTARANLVGVITNGTAVLGLGAIGPLAAKPVMEGKAVLFKKFAGIDVFDIEINEKDPDRLVEIIAALEPTFGAINLEDIKAPECFRVERRLRERMRIPVFHDDQHGTAIIVGAAVLNGLKLVGKSLSSVKLVCSGAGAAALACLELLIELGLPRKNVWVADIEGVVFQGRTKLMDEDKARFAQSTDARTLADLMTGADIFLGLSAGGVCTGEMVRSMAPDPLILALANPTPEILPEQVKAVRDDALIATGRSDYPNQVNNVLCFPFIFRGALDVGATTITREMEIAAVHAIAQLAQEETSDEVATAYGVSNLSFGPDCIIPKPFDPRLMLRIAPAVAQAAMRSGVATRPLADYDAYHAQLQQFVYHSGTFMKPIFAIAKKAHASGGADRVVFAEGEDERVLRAVQVIVDESVARPILIGRPAVIERRLERFGLRMRAGTDLEIVNPESDPRYRQYCQTYHRMTERRGVTEQYARIEMRRRHTLIGAMLIHHGDADAMICGTYGTHGIHLRYLDQVLGRRAGAKVYAAMNILMLPGRQIALVDTHVNVDPSAEEIAEITINAAEELRRLGISPRAALLSHSNFGTSDAPSAAKMRRALDLIRDLAPQLEIDGEMHADCAVQAELRKSIMPHSTLKGDANLLVCPGIDAANISYNLLKTISGNNIAVGPILLGAARPVHILTPSATVRRIVNMAALVVVDASSQR